MKNIKNLSGLDKGSLILAILLLFCLLPLPYGFYIIIRLAVAIIAGCWAYRFYHKGKIANAVIAGGIAILFQPFLKIVLDRVTWNVVDVIIALIIFCLVFRKSRTH